MNLKSSIKAYCLELMNNKLEETSTSGGAGGYLTKKAFRKPKPQDKNSLTGFESSPKPNMYTKTMKFKIVDPKDRLNSKDLWKGEHLEEIKINNPNNQELKDAILNLKDQGEIFLEDNIVIRRYKDLNQFDGEFEIYDFNKPGDDYTTEPEFESNDVNKILNWLQQTKKSLQITNTLSESRYTQFKKSTSKPKPREILHRAIKEIQLKLDEVNRLIEFTTRIKGELQENDQEIEYLKRTKDSLYKIQNKLKEAFSNISKINEIKINNPNIVTLEFEDLRKLMMMGDKVSEKETDNTLEMYGYPTFADQGQWWEELDNQDKKDLISDLNKIINQK